MTEPPTTIADRAESAPLRRPLDLPAFALPPLTGLWRQQGPVERGTTAAEPVVAARPAARPTNTHDHGHHPDHGHVHGSCGHHHPNAHDHSHLAGCSHGLLDHHHDYSHLVARSRTRRMLYVALAIQLTFLAIELVGGVVFHSIALLSDAMHMCADAGAIALALVAARLAARPASPRRTFGFARAEVLAALVNGGTLVLASLWIVFESLRRMVTPQAVHGGGMMEIAALAVLANVVTALVLMRADRHNLNVRATLSHTMLDAMSALVVLGGGAVIISGGPTWIDPVAGIAIATVSIRGIWSVLRTSTDLLLDAVPEHLDVATITTAMLEHPNVHAIRRLHVWPVGQHEQALSAHVVSAADGCVEQTVGSLTDLIGSRFGIHHVTLQVVPSG